LDAPAGAPAAGPPPSLDAVASGATAAAACVHTDASSPVTRVAVTASPATVGTNRTVSASVADPNECTSGRGSSVGRNSPSTKKWRPTGGAAARRTKGGGRLAATEAEAAVGDATAPVDGGVAPVEAASITAANAAVAAVAAARRQRRVAMARVG